jgi:hypothetical protein
MKVSKIERPDDVVVIQDDRDGALNAVIITGSAAAFKAFFGVPGDLKPEMDHVLDNEGRILASCLRFGDRRVMAEAFAADPAAEASVASINVLPDYARRRIYYLERIVADLIAEIDTMKVKAAEAGIV